MFRFYIISEKHGLVAVAHDPDDAEHKALVAAVNTARSVYLHDRLTELDGPRRTLQVIAA